MPVLRPISRNALRLTTLGEWLLLSPLAVFLAAAMLRLLQPPQFQPARASRQLVLWTVRHVGHGLGAMLFLNVLPACVGLSGAAVLVCVWRRDATLRADLLAAARSLWRQRLPVLLGGAVALSLLLIALVAGHSAAHLPQ